MILLNDGFFWLALFRHGYVKNTEYVEKYSSIENVIAIFMPKDWATNLGHKFYNLNSASPQKIFHRNNTTKFLYYTVEYHRDFNLIF